jgi:hypothetical protein
VCCFYQAHAGYVGQALMFPDTRPTAIEVQFSKQTPTDGFNLYTYPGASTRLIKCWDKKFSCLKHNNAHTKWVFFAVKAKYVERQNYVIDLRGRDAARSQHAR